MTETNDTQRMTKIEEEMLGALARGYCSKENEKKTMDIALCKEQLKQLMPVFSQFFVETALEVIQTHMWITAIEESNPIAKRHNDVMRELIKDFQAKGKEIGGE